MKFTILSDLHLDHWFGNKPVVNLKEVYKVLESYLDPSPDVEVLVVAGDLSHEMHHIHLLEEIAIMFNYKKVFMVLGNHDIYLTTTIQNNLYAGSSRRKQEVWYNMKSDIITVLNGTSEVYQGVKFGGAMSWYDGNFNRPVGLSDEMMNKEWRRLMMDSHYLPDYQSLFEIMDQEIPKIEAILDCDVIITHVCPLAANIGIVPEFRDSDSNMFYVFDGEKYLKETNAKYWVFGHSHGFHRFEVYDTECIMNTLGYPSEKRVSHGPINREILL